ncbi:hypothetical protein [Deinococcus yunweiensis]|uniref:hypothetical protein n=1 Tax=Deinococcus yunweiensis TaxID=367282 RepID=UPI00398F4A66
MNQRPALLALAVLLVSCAPRVAAPTQLTTTARYTTGIQRAGEDNPVLAAIVAIAPTAPAEKNRQPWRAEDIESNSVVLRSRPTTTSTAFTLANYPQEMSWNVIATGGVTTVTATHSSAYAAAVNDIFRKLDQRFPRMP